MSLQRYQYRVNNIAPYSTEQRPWLIFSAAANLSCICHASRKGKQPIVFQSGAYIELLVFWGVLSVFSYSERGAGICSKRVPLFNINVLLDHTCSWLPRSGLLDSWIPNLVVPGTCLGCRIDWVDVVQRSTTYSISYQTRKWTLLLGLDVVKWHIWYRSKEESTQRARHLGNLTLGDVWYVESSSCQISYLNSENLSWKGVWTLSRDHRSHGPLTSLKHFASAQDATCSKLGNNFLKVIALWSSDLNAKIRQYFQNNKVPKQHAFLQPRFQNENNIMRKSREADVCSKHIP